MGAPEANTTNIYGIHLRESADDGSDFSNAATDYRVLFLGEDGFLHVKDSAGSVTDPYDTTGGAAGITLIEEKILGSAGVITFSSIAGTYRHLILKARLRNAVSATNTLAALRVGNGALDTGSNYAYAFHRAGATDSDGASESATQINQIQVPAATATAGLFGYAEWEILHYANTTYYRTVGFRGGEPVTSGNEVGTGMGLWKNTASAINTVGIIETTAAANWDTGSAAWLYGLS